MITYRRRGFDTPLAHKDRSLVKNAYATQYLVPNAYQEYKTFYRRDPFSCSRERIYSMLGLGYLKREHYRDRLPPPRNLSFRTLVYLFTGPLSHTTLEALCGLYAIPNKQRFTRSHQTVGAIPSTFMDAYSRFMLRLPGGHVVKPDPIAWQQRTDIPAKTFSGYFNRVACPGLDNLTLILSTLKISFAELLTGRYWEDLADNLPTDRLGAPNFAPSPSLNLTPSLSPLEAQRAIKLTPPIFNDHEIISIDDF